jgi:hypothetical protein
MGQILEFLYKCNYKYDLEFFSRQALRGVWLDFEANTDMSVDLHI